MDATTIPDRVCTYRRNYMSDRNIYYVTRNVTPAPWDGYCTEIKSIRISKNTKTIGEWAFHYLAYANDIIFESRNNADLVIKRNAFEGAGCCTTTGVSSLDLTCVKSLGAEAFKKCTELKQVILEDNLTTVGDSVFVDCPGLWKEGSYIKLPPNNTLLCNNYWKLTPNESITWLPDGSGRKNHPYCDLSGVTYIAPPSKYGQYIPQFNSNVKFYYGELGYWLYSPNTLYIYQDRDYANPSDRPWHSFASSISSASIYTTTIGKNTFNGCTALHFVNSSGIEAHLDNIINIGENAFYGCQQLNMVNLPRIQTIGTRP